MNQMLIMLLLVVGAVAGSLSSGERRRICGRELRRAHDLYCHDVESVPEMSVEIGMPEIVSQKIPDWFTHKLRRSAEKDLDSSLVEACCLKPCHINDLLKNC